MDELVKVLETVPQRWGDQTFSYSKDKASTGFVYTDWWAFYDTASGYKLPSDYAHARQPHLPDRP